MKAPRTITAALSLVIALCVLAGPLSAAPGPQGRKAAVKPEAKPSMPKEVQALIQEGLAARQGRQDIPFSFYKHLILPAQGTNLYPIFFLKAKNGDLGYAPSASVAGEMETTLHLFYELFQSAPDGAVKPLMGGRSMVVLRANASGYNAQQEDWYTFGLGLPAGKYTMALVLCTPDMKKMSVGYQDIALPGPEVYETGLWPTEPVIITSIEQIEPDARPTLHRGHFNWGAIKFVSNEAKEVASGDNLEIFFFVLGAAYKDLNAPRPVTDIEVFFEVKDMDGKPAIKWAPQSYEAYFINQPLPLFQTIQKQDQEGKVLETERKPLPAGNYSLEVKVTDKVSGKTGNAKMAFAVK